MAGSNIGSAGGFPFQTTPTPIAAKNPDVTGAKLPQDNPQLPQTDPPKADIPVAQATPQQAAPPTIKASVTQMSAGQLVDMMTTTFNVQFIRVNSSSEPVEDTTGRPIDGPTPAPPANKPPTPKPQKLAETKFKVGLDIAKLKNDAKGAELFEKAMKKLEEIAKTDISDADFADKAGVMRGLMNLYMGKGPKDNMAIVPGNTDQLTSELKKYGLLD